MMTKQEVELIIFKVTADGQDAINMKIYKNGTTCRYGVGGLPQLRISGMSFFNNSGFFDPLIAKIPDEVLQEPLMYEEETPNGYLEYVIAFYGVSGNGDTGENADWTKSTGIRIKLDRQTTFKHPIMSFLDNLTLDATELTNEWYFDIMLKAKYKALSSTMPKETIITQPKTESEIHADFENYINQMMGSTRNWSMAGFDKNKTYEIEGRTYRGVIQQDNDTLLNLLQIEYRTDSLTEQLAERDFETLRRLGFHQSAWNLLFERDEYQHLKWNRDSLAKTLTQSDEFIYPWFEDNSK